MESVGGTPPPSSMVLPATIVNEVDNTTQAYLTVLQEFDSCPVRPSVQTPTHGCALIYVFFV